MICLFHKYEDVKFERLPNMFSYLGAPILRLEQKCSKCKKERYMKLTLSVSDKVINDNSLKWQEI